jgi:hypothetical protein
VIRDSQGRVRTEQQLGLGMPPKPGETGIFSLVTVRDPVAGFLYVFDDEAKLVHRFKLSSAPSIPSSIPVPRQAASGIESLGTQVIEGVEALGHRSVRTLAAGEAGNQQPITITNEYWYSKDLQQNILQKLSDPRSGDRTTRWTNISRSEPDPSLFALPEGFTVVDEADTFTITLHRH